MFIIIRLIVSCVFLGCSIMIIKNKAIHKRVLYVAFATISVALFIALSFFPFENLFVTFDSPKEAYEYYNWGESNIELVIEGNRSDFVVDCKKDFGTYLIIPKSPNGWKIGIGSNTKRVIQKEVNGIIVYVYQYKNTNDFFVTILDTSGGESNVSDDYNTQFFSLEMRNDVLGKTFVTYYAHVPNFNTQYSVIVNGNKIELQSQ